MCKGLVTSPWKAKLNNLNFTVFNGLFGSRLLVCFCSDMKHLPYMVVMMTSWLCMRGHCSVKVKCKDDHQEWEGQYLHVNCTIDFSPKQIITTECIVNETCKVNDRVAKCTIPAREEKKFELKIVIPRDVVKINQVANLTLDIGCDPDIYSEFNISKDPKADQSVGKEVGKEDNHHQALWAIGGTGIVIVIVIVGFVLFKLKGHRTRSGSSSLRLWRRTQSADTDVERNDGSSSCQDSDCEPLSGGQEPRDTHTPPATSHTDDTSS